MLTVAVLGSPELRRDGARVAVPAGKTTELLVRLALDAGRVVSTDRLLDDLWGDATGAVERNTLQSKASKLRRALGSAEVLAARPPGYVLTVDPADVDALEVLRLLQSALTHQAAGDATAAVAACTAAEARFGGDLLPGAGDGAWVALYRSRLAAARWQLRETRLAARLAQGAGAELVGELEGLLAEDPLREGLWVVLVTALYRSGRQADALAAYARAEQHLADELGLDPGPALRALRQQVLRHDPTLVPAAPVRGNVAGLSSGLVGRADDLRAVRQLLAARRLVTIVGPAGVGKTRLATELARTDGRPDGGWLVRLEGATSAAAVWESIGDVFGLPLAGEAAVLERLRVVDLLLVLDNCEHLVEPLGAVVERLAATAPTLTVLTTSQLPLGVDGETVHPLAPLGVADAVALFAERATERRSTFRTEADDEVLETVCRSLDGLPLAIELAAARVRTLSLADIARRLGDRFSLLTDPTSRRAPRHRALGAAIAWSYDLLGEDDRRGLWALACFGDGAPLEAVEAVLPVVDVPVGQTLDVITRLADRSLVTVHVGPSGGRRYRLLDSVRAYALDRLRETPYDERAHAAHARWYAVLADRARAGVRGAGQAGQVAVAAAERVDIDAALVWAHGHDPALGLRIALGFGWVWVVQGAGTDAAARLRRALDAAATAAVAATDASPAPADLVDGWLVTGWLEASGGRLDRADADLDEADRRAGALADHGRLAVVALHRAFVASQRGDPVTVLALLDHSRAALPTDHTWETAANWLLTAWAEIAVGHLDRGRAACTTALAGIERLGDRWGQSQAEAILGGLAQAEQAYDVAVAHLSRAATAAQELGFRALEAHHRTTLGQVHQQADDLPAAEATLRTAVDLASACADLRTAALARVELGRVLLRRGELDEARALATTAGRWYDATGGGDGAALAATLLATLDAER